MVRGYKGVFLAQALELVSMEGGDVPGALPIPPPPKRAHAHSPSLALHPLCSDHTSQTGDRHVLEGVRESVLQFLRESLKPALAWSRKSPSLWELPDRGCRQRALVRSRQWTSAL